MDDDQAIWLDQARELVEETTMKFGPIADLFLIHNPFVAKPGELKQVWNILEDLKTEGRLKRIGVSNFQVQDLEAVLKLEIPNAARCGRRLPVAVHYIMQARRAGLNFFASTFLLYVDFRQKGEHPKEKNTMSTLRWASTSIQYRLPRRI